MSNQAPIFKKNDLKAYLWLAALAALGFFARAEDFAILHYVLNFGLACLVLFVGTVAVRRLDARRRFRDAIGLLAFMGVFAILLFPIRSPGTSIASVVLAFLALYLTAAVILMLWKRFAGRFHPTR